MMNQHLVSMDADRSADEFPAVSPPSLKEITLTNISISLFNHKNNLTNELFDWNEFQADVISRLKLLPFQADLEPKVAQIANEISKWVRAHAGKILHNRYVCYALFGAIPFFSWHQKGTINYEETAVNMLMSSNLNECIKLRLSFLYNLEYDINKILVREEMLTELLTYFKWNKDDDILKKVLSTAGSNFLKNLTKNTIFINHCERLLFNYEKRAEFEALKNLSCPDPEELAAFKKTMIFSQKSIGILRNKMQNGCWSQINHCMDQYLSNKEDKDILKKQLFELENLNDPITFARKMCLGNDGSYSRILDNKKYWHSLLLWYFGSTENVIKFKSTLPVESIFDDLLQFSVFNKHDELNRLSYCRFKSVLNVCFGPVNRFLMWFFDTPDQIEKYKYRRAKYCEKIPMIKTLMKKKNKTYLRLVFRWLGANTIKYDGKNVTSI